MLYFISFIIRNSIKANFIRIHSYAPVIWKTLITPSLNPANNKVFDSSQANEVQETNGSGWHL
jgi:hypothetical protein